MKKNNILKIILSHLEEIISGSFLIFTTVLVIINVFMRYFLRTGLYWTEEVATGSFVWAVFIGAVAGFKRHQHIGVDFLLLRLPQGIQTVVRFFVDIILLLINGYLTYLSFVFIRASYIKPTPVLGISSAYISSALLVSFFLMTIYSAIFLVQNLTHKGSMEEGV